MERNTKSGFLRPAQAVTALSSEDAWAVGQSISQTLVENWDGTQWVEVPSPNIGTYDLLAGVYAISTNDVWAVGYKDYDANNNTASTFTLHWNGTAWSEIPSPKVDSANYLAGVDGASSDDVWAVGTSTSGPIPFHTLALH
jgi:hypothetical protein